MEGTITRKDIISDDALAWGTEYAKLLDVAIGKNKEFVDTIVLLNAENVKLRRSENQTEFIKQKNEVKLLTEKAIGLIKEEQLAEIAMEKVKQERIKTDKQILSLENQKENSSKKNVKLSHEERFEAALLTKQLKLEWLERRGLIDSYTKLNNARTEAKNKLRDLIASEKASTAEIKKAQKEFDILDNKVKKADRAVGDFSKNVGNYKSAFSGIGDIFAAFGIVGGVTAFAAITKDIFSTTKELQSLDLALKSVTGSQENFNAQQTFLNTIAEKYGLEIKNLTKQYTAFYVAAKDKLAAQEIQDLFENIAKSGSALGLSNETLERSFVAVNQMLSKGTVASEELRGQLAEALPGAVQAMTKAVQVLHPEIKNLTEKGLFEMIKSGKILASEVLPETARQLVILTGADKAEGIDTLTKSTNRLSNAWTNVIRGLTDGDSWISKLTRGVIKYLAINPLEGWADYLKNDAEARKDVINKTYNDGYVKQKEYLKKTKDLSKEDIENIKKYNEDKIKENTKEIKELDKKYKQIDSLKINTPLGAIESRENERAKLAIKQKKAELENFTSLLKGENSAITEFSAPKLKVQPTETEDERNKREAAEKKAAAEALKRLQDDLDAKKRIYDADYELKKTNLERQIKLANEVANDEKEAEDVRIAALELSKDKEIELTKLTTKKLLDYDLFVVEKKKLLETEKEKIEKEGSNKIVDIKKKTAKEIDKINQFDPKVYEANLKEGVSKIEIAMNEELAIEEKRFQAELELGFKNDKLKEKAEEEHQKNLFNIKKEALVAQTKLQLSSLDAEINAYEQKAKEDGVITQEETAYILEKRRQLKELSVKLIKSEGETFKDNETKKSGSVSETLAVWYKENEKTINDIAKISSEALGQLSDLGAAFSQRKIQELDDEISKNNEYYDRQIELAGNDQRQKDLLQKERDKKNEELEKKKRKEQEKQAKFDKAVSIAQIAIQTALAVMKAAPNPYWMAAMGVMGAIQLAVAIATPIPKYKHGRKGGKAEFAEVGDGYVSEVITKADGSSPRVTPNKPTLTFLEQGDIVHKSVDDYNRYMRASILNKFSRDNEMVKGFQMNQNGNIYGKDLLDELKRNTQAIEKNKGNIIVQSPKMDLGYEIWKMNNLNWK